MHIFVKFVCLYPLAGGLATYIHADYVKSVLSPIVKYHALADAGYFIDGQNTQGQYFIQTVYEYGMFIMAILSSVAMVMLL